MNHEPAFTMPFHLPTITHPGLFPDDVDWPDLAELRTEHARLVRAFNAAETERRRVVRQRSEADRQDREARLAAVELGVAPRPLTKTAADWDADVAEATRNVEAATTALERFHDRVLKAVPEHERDWAADLNRREAEAEQMRAEAKRLLAEADHQVSALLRTRTWIDLAANGRLNPADHARAEFPVAVPSEETADAGA